MLIFNRSALPDHLGNILAGLDFAMDLHVRATNIIPLQEPAYYLKVAFAIERVLERNIFGQAKEAAPRRSLLGPADQCHRIPRRTSGQLPGVL